MTTPRGTYNQYDGSSTSISGVSVQIGDLVVVGCSYAVGLSTVSASDNASGGSNAYQLIASGQSSTGGASGYVFAARAKVTETLTISVSLFSDPGLWIVVYPGPYSDLASALGSVASAFSASSSSTAETSNAVTTYAGGFAVALWFQELSSGYTLTSTNEWDKRAESTTHCHHVLDVDTAANGSVSSSVSISPSGTYNALVVSFKPATPPGPVITTQPESAASVEGGSATFTSAATGATSVKVQQNTGSGWTDIADATSTTYTKTGLALADSGLQIRFAFSDGTNTTYSNAATLQVGAASARLYPVLGGNPIGSFGWLGRAGAASPIRTAGCGAVSVHASDARLRAYAG